VVVKIFLTSTTVVLNHFAEDSQMQTYDVVREAHKKIYHKSIDIFCFIALTRSATQNIGGVTERHCLSKKILSQQVVGNWGLKDPALFFVCLLYSPLKNAHFISQAYH